MKKIVFSFLFMMITAISFSQDVRNSYWGDSKQKVIASVGSPNYVENVEKGTLTYKLDLGDNIKRDLVYIFDKSGKLYSVTIGLLYDEYDQAKSDFEAEYGPFNEYRFQTCYRKLDERTVLMLKAQKHDAWGAMIYLSTKYMKENNINF